MGANPIPTPDELRALAARAVQLITDLARAQESLRGAGDEPTRRVGWRLDEGAGQLREAAVALTETARDLEFILIVRGRPHCPADGGCCPEHGLTLASTGGRCWCTAPGCRRSWEWRRLSLPCDEPPAFRVVDPQGGEVVVCAGHAVAARMLAGWRVVPLGSRREERSNDR
jgi:hypothetical protein